MKPEDGAGHQAPPASGGAERLMGDAERSAEELTQSAVRWITRTAARAREELEDIWAEAQSIRNGK